MNVVWSKSVESNLLLPKFSPLPLLKMVFKERFHHNEPHKGNYSYQQLKVAQILSSTKYIHWKVPCYNELQAKLTTCCISV